MHTWEAHLLDGLSEGVQVQHHHVYGIHAVRLHGGLVFCVVALRQQPAVNLMACAYM